MYRRSRWALAPRGLAAAIAFTSLSLGLEGAAGAKKVTPPEAPSQPTISASTGSRPVGTLDVTWTALDPGAGSPILRYRAKVEGQSDAKCSAPSNATSCSIGGLKNGVAYTVVIKAENAGGWSPFSVPSETATPVGGPSRPRSIYVETGDRSATVSWAAPVSDGGSPITSYTVSSKKLASQECTRPDPSGCTFGHLRNGVPYRFKVVAHNALGQSLPAVSSPAVASTTPGAPGNVRGAGGDGSVWLVWDPPANDGGSAVTGYKVFIDATGRKVCTVVQNTCLATGLTNGWRYRFYVEARNFRGWGSPSHHSSWIMPATTPSSPNAFHADAGDGYVNVGWTPPSSTGGVPIDSYAVFIIGQAFPSCVTTGLSCTIGGLANGTAYAFQVFAHNAKGYGPPATSGYATPRVQPVVVMSMSGSGVQTGPAFTIPDWATHWTESWSYSCAGTFFDYGNFITWIDRVDGGYTTDAGVNELGSGGSNTNYYYDHGTFQVEVISECSWTETITYYPPGA